MISFFLDEVFRVADIGLDRGFDSLQSSEESFSNKVTRHRYSIGDSEELTESSLYMKIIAKKP